MIVVGDEYFGNPFTRMKTAEVPGELRREPANRHDRNAIAVHLNGSQVGYLSAARAAKYAPMLDALGGAALVTLRISQGEAWVKLPSPK
ncbi:hypothetical protein GCM10010932_14030 [Agromyces flavus]|nr:hypothetical protein GCM10010932_14030 [Agromyces flavus]